MDSIRKLIEISLGAGSIFIDTDNTIEPNEGKYFFCMIPNEEITIAEMTVETGWADLSGKTLALGIPVYTHCTSIKLSSGSVSIYQRTV